LLFRETIKPTAAGMVSSQQQNPGITRGNHSYKKVERFAVIKGSSEFNCVRNRNRQITGIWKLTEVNLLMCYAWPGTLTTKTNPGDE
jgi:hypothetical protein